MSWTEIQFHFNSSKSIFSTNNLLVKQYKTIPISGWPKRDFTLKWMNLDADNDYITFKFFNYGNTAIPSKLCRDFANRADFNFYWTNFGPFCNNYSQTVCHGALARHQKYPCRYFTDFYKILNLIKILVDLNLSDAIVWLL